MSYCTLSRSRAIRCRFWILVVLFSWLSWSITNGASAAAVQDDEAAVPAAAEDSEAADSETAGEDQVAPSDADADPDAEDHSEADAHGGEGESHSEASGEEPALLSFNPGEAVWNLLIFLVVLLILGLFVWPQILDGLQAREDKVRGDLAAAAEANAQAKANLAEYQKRLDDAQGQVQQMLAEARRDAEQAGVKIVAEAKEDAGRVRERALADIETAKSGAIADLANQTSDMAMALARQVVGRELKPEDHADLIRQSLEKLPSRN